MLRAYHFSLSLLVICCFSPAVLGEPDSADPCITSDSELTPLGQIANYTCTGFYGDFGSAVVVLPDSPDRELDTLDVDDEAQLQARGITFENDILMVLASEENNLTEVKCKEAQPPFGTASSAVLVFIVIGPPLPPYVNSTLIDDIEILLEWEEPFTWPDHDILYYEVTRLLDSGDQSAFRTNNMFHQYFTPSGGVAELCQALAFIVTAVSDLGASKPSAAVRLGFPIAPGMFEEDIRTTVEFLESGDPIVDITLQAPTVCDYQEAVLTVSVAPLGGADRSLPVIMERYSGQPEPTVIEHSTSTGLLPNITYSIHAYVETTLGNSSTTSMFDTIQTSQSAGSMTMSCGVIDILLALMIIMMCFP